MKKTVSIKHIILLSNLGKTALPWAFKVNSVLTTAENFHVKDCMLKVK
jgi:hypothetical protein